MFTTLPERFKAFHLQVDVRTLLLLQKAIDRSLVKTIGDLYNVLRTFIVKESRIDGTLHACVLRLFFVHRHSQWGTVARCRFTFSNLSTMEGTKCWPLEEDMTRKDMANLFLMRFTLTHYDIQKIIDGRALEKDSGDLEDKDAQNEEENGERRPLDRMADYSDLSARRITATHGRSNETTKP